KLKMISMISLFCGGLITLFGLLGFMINTKVLYVLYSNGFLSPSHSNIYILAFCNIFGNTLQLFISLFYLGPTSTMQTDYFAGGTNSTGTKFFSWVFLGAWYSNMFLQPVVASNRLIMVIFPICSHIFSKNKTIFYGTMALFLGFFLAFFSDFVIPCCIAYVYYGVYSYFYIGTDFNYVNTYIDLPVNSSSSFISILFYIIIFIYVRKNNLKASKFAHEQHSSKKIKEVRYAVQFAFCSIIALMAWVTFRFFPIVVPSDQLAWFTVIAMCLILHCVANSLIFVFFNKEFRDRFLGRSIDINSSNTAPQFSMNTENIPAAKATPSEGTPQNDQQ
ncbi:hypothetical protein FO519_009818, partial [Halicephalobus sp. NKZ332]